MRTIRLVDLAHARSGDKGDTANVGVIAYREEDYELLAEKVTAEAVKRHFGGMVGEVERFELPNLNALNFLLHEALDGGGTVSLMNDAQGKVFSTALLRMEIEVPDGVVEAMEGRGRLPREEHVDASGARGGAHTGAPGGENGGSAGKEGRGS